MLCSRPLLLLALGPRPFSGRERVGPFWSLRARASFRLPAPSILSCRSRLGPPGGALSLLKLHSGTRSIALRRVQTTSPCFFLGFASACQPVGCPCQSSESLAPLFLYTSFLHTPSYTRLSLSKIPFSGAESKRTPQMSLINIYDILIITMNAKIHHEQIIKNLSQDGISITDIFPLVSGFNLAQPGTAGFHPPSLSQGQGFCFCLSPAESLSSRPWLLL